MILLKSNVSLLIMPNLFIVATFFTTFLVGYGESSDYFVTISHNGPVVQGATITFQAELYRSDGSRPSGTFSFKWEDNAIRQHQWEEQTTIPSSVWNVTYPTGQFYYPGEYEVQVNVDKKVIFYYHICSRRSTFNVTGLLNGQMDLAQTDTISTDFVSNNAPLQHKIALSEPDMNYLKKNATQVATYWFVDCILYGQTENFLFNYTYATVDKEHYIEALVVASYDPITTTVAPTTTTSTTSSSTAIPTTPSTPISTQAFLNGTNNSLNGTIVPYSDAPYICLNNSIVPPDPMRTYGYFRRHVTVKSPVQNITISGTNWLQQYEILDLKVNCNGSSVFKTCYYKEHADYNVTGKETCMGTSDFDSCHFGVTKYFSYENYTMLIIISNEVSKVVYPVSVIIYKVQKHAQLSVIVVPVVCSVLAVIMIVFGVAYYVQSRKRFTVEVADFDFGQGVGELEYKTFRERLREAVVNSLNRDFGMDGESNVWSPSRKYGSMQ